MDPWFLEQILVTDFQKVMKKLVLFSNKLLPKIKLKSHEVRTSDIRLGGYGVKERGFYIYIYMYPTINISTAYVYRGEVFYMEGTELSELSCGESASSMSESSSID